MTISFLYIFEFSINCHILQETYDIIFLKLAYEE